jgi:hypothetical protein
VPYLLRKELPKAGTGNDLQSPNAYEEKGIDNPLFMGLLLTFTKALFVSAYFPLIGETKP